MLQRSRFRLSLVLVLATALRTNMPAQIAGEMSSQDGGKPAGALLRTYVNLVQVPVLVLSGEKQPLPTVDASRFRVSLDSGPLFAPKHVRREGSDPIRLMTLVEQSSLSSQTVEAVPASLGALNASLLPQDTLTVAASFGCVLVSSAPMHPGADFAAAATRVMQRAKAEQPDAEQQKRCGKGSHLWDNLASSLARLQGDPARRVVLVLTDGLDESSKVLPSQVRQMGTRVGAAIFAIRREDPAPQTPVVTTVGGYEHMVYRMEGDPLIMVTESTGGMVLQGRRKPLAEELGGLIATIRNRYIVDFVRPTTLPGGSHTILVSIGDKVAFVRAGGTSVPLPGPEETNDPDRTPADHSGEPPIGKRRILK